MQGMRRVNSFPSRKPVMAEPNHQSFFEADAFVRGVADWLGGSSTLLS